MASLKYPQTRASSTVSGASTRALGFGVVLVVFCSFRFLKFSGGLGLRV